MLSRSLGALVLAAAAAPLRAEEAVDLEMVTRIRDEGYTHSQVMETAGHLTDVIGARVTGSPQMKEANDWTRRKLESWGLSHAHLEPFHFGRGWSLEKATVQMVAPAPATLIAVPRAFTPGTDGPRRAPVVKVHIETEKDIERYRGQLAGRMVLVGDPRPLPTPEKPAFTRHTDADLAELARFQDTSGRRRPFDGKPSRGACASSARCVRSSSPRRCWR